MSLKQRWFHADSLARNDHKKIKEVTFWGFLSCVARGDLILFRRGPIAVIFGVIVFSGDDNGPLKNSFKFYTRLHGVT